MYIYIYISVWRVSWSPGIANCRILFGSSSADLLVIFASTVRDFAVWAEPGNNPNDHCRLLLINLQCKSRIHLVQYWELAHAPSTVGIESNHLSMAGECCHSLGDILGSCRCAQHYWNIQDLVWLSLCRVRLH